MRRELTKRAAEHYGIRVLLYAVALSLVGIPFGFLLDQVVRDGPFLTVDTYAANHLHEIVRHHPIWVDILQIVTFTGKPPFLALCVIVVGVFLLRRRRYHLAIYLVTSVIVGGLIDTWVKLAVGRDRPSLEHPVASAAGASFPSGHAMSSTIAYGAMLLILMPLIPPNRRRLAIAAVAGWVVIIGCTRLALGVHYISDVISGIALGGAWLALTTAAFEIWRKERGLGKTDPVEEGVGAV